MSLSLTSSGASSLHPLADPLFSLGEFCGRGREGCRPAWRGACRTGPRECARTDARSGGARAVTGGAAGLNITAHCAAHKSPPDGFLVEGGSGGSLGFMSARMRVVFGPGSKARPQAHRHEHCQPRWSCMPAPPIIGGRVCGSVPLLSRASAKPDCSDAPWFGGTAGKADSWGCGCG